MNYKTKDNLSQQYHLYRQHGLRAIPTQGNMAKTVVDIKKPPVGFLWGEVDKPLTDNQINPYLDAGYDGFAAIMGRGWAALDFDAAADYDDFRANFPYMEDTMINLSGGKHLPHVWFRYPEDMLLDTNHTSGVDLQATGSYLMCPPTQAYGRKYTNERGDLDSVIRLTRFQIEDIQQWVYSRKPVMPDTTPIGRFIEDFTALYEELRQYYGSRNYGYFFSLLRAQASSQRQALIDMVHPIFVYDTTNRYESPYEREAEALRIEASALNYRLSGTSAVPLTLPEQLCNLRYELGGQVLNGLWGLGMSGKYLPSPQIVEALQPLGMSRMNIYRGINQLNEPEFRKLLASYQSTNMDIFSNHLVDAEHTLYRGHNLVQPDNLTSLSSSSTGYSSEHTLYRGHNLVQHYIPEIPDSVTLLPSWGIRTGRNFRLAMMFDLISHHPKQYSREELADRTGLSVSAIKNYLRTLRTSGAIEAEKRVDVIPLSFGTLRSIMTGFNKPRWGAWLQDETDKPYPAIHGLAARLLSEGRSVSLMKMRPNFYSVKASDNS